MADLDFSPEVLLEQARGNETAFWHLALRWARQHEGSVDRWAEFVGEQFALSWDELGDRASALDVARLAGLNVATTAASWLSPSVATAICEPSTPGGQSMRGYLVADRNRRLEEVPVD